MQGFGDREMKLSVRDRVLKFGITSKYLLLQQIINDASKAGDYYEGTTEDAMRAQRGVDRLDKRLKRLGRKK